MVERNVQVCESVLGRHARNRLGFEINRNTEGLEDGSVSRTAGNAVISVHEDGSARSSGEDGSSGQSVKGVLLAGIRGQIDNPHVLWDGQGRDVGPRRGGERSELGHGLHLESHRDEKCSHLSRRRLTFDQRPHRPLGLIPGEIFGGLGSLGDFGDEFLHAHYDAL